MLGPTDPTTEQVRALLEMARAVPRPKVSSAARHALRPKGSRLPGQPEDISSIHRPAVPVQDRKGADGEQSIFRPSAKAQGQASAMTVPNAESSASTRTPRKEKGPPLRHVSVSPDDLKKPTSSRIFVMPHHVPSSPSQRNASDDAINTTWESSLTPDNSLIGAAPRNAVPLQKKISYDAEESCLISETGVESDHGRIHYPLSWNKAGLNGTGSPRREIMVTRPFRGKSASKNSIAQSDSTVSSDPLASDAVYSTGNKERDDVMTRAKAILNAHHNPPIRQGSLLPTGDDHTEFSDDDRNPGRTFQPMTDDMGQEDGFAPLGGEWPRESSANRPFSDLLLDPMNHLHVIHDEAVALLHVRWSYQ